MRTYRNAVSRIATHVFNEYMGGGYGGYGDVGMVAYIFGKTSDRVQRDVEAKLEEIKDIHYRGVARREAGETPEGSE